MAKISREEIIKLAKLSKIRLNEAEVEAYREDLSSILDYVEQLNQIDTSHVKPTSQVTGLVDVMRADEIDPSSISPEELLKNLPDRKDNYIKTKRVL